MPTSRPSKYDPLIDHLAAQSASEVTLTFADVERLLGEPLPQSAYKHGAYWANSANDPTHSWARRWVADGWLAQVDQDAHRVVFRRGEGSSCWTCVLGRFTDPASMRVAAGYLRASPHECLILCLSFRAALPAPWVSPRRVAAPDSAFPAARNLACIAPCDNLDRSKERDSRG